MSRPPRKRCWLVSDALSAAISIGSKRFHTALAHVDVVRGLEEIARSSAGEIAVPIPWPCDRIAAVVQAADGRVLGVAVRDVEPL